MDVWQWLLDCRPGEPSDPGDHGRVTRTAPCRDGSELAQYDLRAWVTWPQPSHGIDTDQAMWKFFVNHARGGDE